MFCVLMRSLHINQSRLLLQRMQHNRWTHDESGSRRRRRRSRRLRALLTSVSGSTPAPVNQSFYAFGVAKLLLGLSEYNTDSLVAYSKSFPGK